MPFEYNSTLHYIQQIHPLQIRKVVEVKSVGDHILYYYRPAILETAYEETKKVTLPWHGHMFGHELRGGTNAVYVPKLGCFIAFFHTCTHVPFAPDYSNHLETYFMGAFTFQAEPVFKLLSMSAIPILKYHDFYDVKWTNRKKDYVVFPQGLILSDDQKELIVSLGHQDKDGYIVTFDLEALLHEMYPVTYHD